MEAFSKIPTEEKRKEIISKINFLITTMTNINKSVGLEEDFPFSKDMFNIENNNLSEDDYLLSLFSYINCLENLLEIYSAKMKNNKKYL